MSIFIESGVTCGVEFECDIIRAENLMGESRNLQEIWHPTHDASIETDTTSYGSFTIMPEITCKYLAGRRTTIGVELVSEILNSNSDRFFQRIDELTAFLQENGETSKSERSGIHFHISLPSPNLGTLKNILRLGNHFEKLFFTIGGMGYEQRGLKNDCTYAKPTTLFGPPCVKTGNRTVAQIYELEKVLQAKTLEEFWFYFGDIPAHDRRYTPIRYMWLNLYPVYPGREYKGTVEFRIFNKNLNPEFIYSAFMLCRNFLDVATRISYSQIKNAGLDTINSVYDKDTQLMEYLLDELADISEMDQRVKKILNLILARSPEVFVERKYLWTHLINRMERGFWEGSDYMPKIISPTIIFAPKYIDIHRLRGEN